MICILSPAKSMDFSSCDFEKGTKPLFLKKTWELVSQLKRLTEEDWKRVMSMSDRITQSTYDSFRHFRKRHDFSNSKQALLTYSGDAFRGLNALQWNEEDWQYAQEKLFVLSGLYGLLGPTDLIQPYRLEMAARFRPEGAHNLYEFWNQKINTGLSKMLSKTDTKVILNLASTEYSKILDHKILGCPVITPHFREFRGGTFRLLSFKAKRARGLMARYFIRQRIQDPEELKGFDLEGYSYDPTKSSESEWYFVGQAL